jgi:hypothetical protein
MLTRTVSVRPGSDREMQASRRPQTQPLLETSSRQCRRTQSGLTNKTRQDKTRQDKSDTKLDQARQKQTQQLSQSRGHPCALSRSKGSSLPSLRGCRRGVAPASIHGAGRSALGSRWGWLVGSASHVGAAHTTTDCHGLQLLRLLRRAQAVLRPVRDLCRLGGVGVLQCEQQRLCLCEPLLQRRQLGRELLVHRNPLINNTCSAFCFQVFSCVCPEPVLTNDRASFR